MKKKKICILRDRRTGSLIGAVGSSFYVDMGKVGITYFIGAEFRDKGYSRPSISSFMIINLDKTIISEQIADVIISGLLASNKLFRKVAFVGVDKNWQKEFVKIKAKGTIITFLFDYEKAKEWVFAD